MRPRCGCRWSQTYGEGGRYSVRIQVSEAAAQPSCTHAVDTPPRNAHLREYDGGMRVSPTVELRGGTQGQKRNL